MLTQTETIEASSLSISSEGKRFLESDEGQYSPESPIRGGLRMWKSLDALVERRLEEDDASSAGYVEKLEALQEYVVVLTRLRELREVDDDFEDDYGGALAPTDYAFTRAQQLLANTFALIRNSFTRAAVSTSFEGGIRIEWMQPDSSVRAIIPAHEDEEGYIYYESGDTYGTSELSPHALASHLANIIAQAWYA